MKLLSVNLARSIWLGHMGDFNPRGLNIYHHVIPSLKELYKFKKYPLPQDILDESVGVKLEGGEYVTKIDDPIHINLTFYSDGIMADTQSSTKDSDDFLHEILTNFSEDFNAPPYEDVIKKRNYISQLYVNLDKSLELINQKLKEISKYLSKNVIGFEEVSFETGGISFWANQKQSVNPVAFSLERALNYPFSENRYYSVAPLPTEKHLELLGKLESIIST